MVFPHASSTLNQTGGKRKDSLLLILVLKHSLVEPRLALDCYIAVAGLGLLILLLPFPKCSVFSYL